MRISDWSSDVCSSDLDAVSQRGAKLDWNRTFMLDREIGDTFACIDTIGRGKCLGRASLLTCIAATAAIPARAVWSQLQCGIDRTQEQPDSVTARYQIAVIALPAQPRRLAQGFPHNRTRITK